MQRSLYVTTWCGVMCSDNKDPMPYLWRLTSVMPQCTRGNCYATFGCWVLLAAGWYVKCRGTGPHSPVPSGGSQPNCAGKNTPPYEETHAFLSWSSPYSDLTLSRGGTNARAQLVASSLVLLVELPPSIYLYSCGISQLLSLHATFPGPSSPLRRVCRQA